MTEQLWSKRAGFSDLRAVLDPNDQRGIKNYYIDLIQKAALARHFSIAPSHVVLDFGCGLGRMSGWLAEHARLVIGIDLAAEMLRAARQQHSESHLAWVCYSSGLPLGDECLDRVLSVGVLQHILGEPALQATVAELTRILKPGGQIALIEQVRHGQSCVVEGYVEQRPASEYVTMFRAAGCVSSHVSQVRMPWFLTTLVGTGFIPRSLLRPLAWFDTRASQYRKATHTYADCLFVFQKPRHDAGS